MPDRCITITGMHRSGTSVVSRLVSLLGVDLGEPAGFIRPLPDNQAGFFESRALVRFQQSVLAALGGSWDDPPVLEDGWVHQPRLGWARSRAPALVGELFGAVAVAGWKDPRTSLLLPLWRATVPLECNVLVVRDPREVAGSLATRNRLPTERSAYLWLRYTVAAWRDFPRRIVVDLDEVRTDVEATIRMLTGALGLPSADAATLAAAGGAIRPELLHAHRVAAEGPLMRLALRHRALLRSGDVAGYDAAAQELHQRWLRAGATDRRLRRVRTALRPLVHHGVRRRLRVRVGAMTGSAARRATLPTTAAPADPVVAR